MKNSLINLLLGIVIFLAFYFGVSWLVDGSIWLHLILAAALTNPITIELGKNLDEEMKILKIQVQHMNDEITRLTSILDATESQSEVIDEIDARLKNLEYRFRDV